MDLLAGVDLSAVWRLREPLAWGLPTTLRLAAAAFAVAVPGGLLLA